MFSQNLRMSAVAAIILASCLWGTTGTVAAFAPDIGPLTIGAFAMGGSGVLWLAFCWRELLVNAPKLRRHWCLLGAGALAVSLYPLAFYSAMRLSGVAIGTLVSIASAPLFAAVLEYALLDTRLPWRWYLSCFCGVTGVTLLAIAKSASPADSVTSQYFAYGLALGLGAGLTYAIYAWCGKQLMHRGVGSRPALAAMFGLASCVLLPALVVNDTNLFASPQNASVAIYMAVLPMFVGYLCFAHGLRYLEASSATLITLLEPAIAMVLAVVVLGESFGATAWPGLMFVIVTTLSSLAPTRSKVRLQEQKRCPPSNAVNTNAGSATGASSNCARS